jgi:hypothetical protein
MGNPLTGPPLGSPIRGGRLNPRGRVGRPPQTLTPEGGQQRMQGESGGFPFVAPSPLPNPYIKSPKGALLIHPPKFSLPSLSSPSRVFLNFGTCVGLEYSPTYARRRAAGTPVRIFYLRGFAGLEPGIRLYIVRV